MPWLVPCPLASSARPGHQEDVVVDAERHEEHEGEQRHPVVERREAEHVREDHPRQAQAGEEGRRRTVATSTTGGGQRPQQQHRARRATSSRMIGRITWRSRGAASDASSAAASVAAHDGVAPGRPPTASRRAGPVSDAASDPGSPSMHGVDLGRRRCRWRPAFADPTPSTAARRGDDCRDRRRGCHHVGGSAAPAGKACASRSCPAMASGFCGTGRPGRGRSGSG